MGAWSASTSTPAASRRCGKGVDATGEFRPDELAGLDLHYTDDAADLAGCTCFLVTVPTPIDRDRQPDLTRPAPRLRHDRVRAAAGRPGGVREHRLSGPHRGDLRAAAGGRRRACARARTSSSATRPSASTRATASTGWRRIRQGGRGRRRRRPGAAARRSTGRWWRRGCIAAPSIRVAEAAKVIENTQRDLNIALMNELALICDRLGIRTHDVLAAAGTKWNFLPFTPGLVGGHCIGVDPYYLTAKAERLGYHPEVILAGRRINDGMGAFVAQKLVKLLIAREVPVRRARVGRAGPDLQGERARPAQQPGARHPGASWRASASRPRSTTRWPTPAPRGTSTGWTLAPLEAAARARRPGAGGAAPGLSRARACPGWRRCWRRAAS